MVNYVYKDYTLLLKCNITLPLEPPEMSLHFVAHLNITLLLEPPEMSCDIDIPPPPCGRF